MPRFRLIYEHLIHCADFRIRVVILREERLAVTGLAVQEELTCWRLVSSQSDVARLGASCFCPVLFTLSVFQVIHNISFVFGGKLIIPDLLFNIAIMR